MAVRFLNQTGDKRITLICRRMNEDSLNGYIANLIKTRAEPFDQRFTSSNATPNVIADLWNSSELEMKIKYYTTWNPWSGAYGMVLSNDPTTMYLNTRRMNRSDGSVAASIIHEGGHGLDITNPNYVFNHGDNSPAGKENSFQYWLDNKYYEKWTDTPSIVDSSVVQKRGKCGFIY